MKKPSSRRARVLRRFGVAMAVLGGALPLLSCGDGVTGPSDLTGGVWKLQSMQIAGASRFVPDNPDRFTVELHSDGRIGVVADCNSCGGTYSLNGDTLTVPSLACTLVLCATPYGGEFAGLIEGTTTVDKDGGHTLEIESANGKLTLAR